MRKETDDGADRRRANQPLGKLHGSAEEFAIIFPRRKAGESSRMEDRPVLVTIKILEELSHMHLSDAAEKLGVSPTAVKKACRKLGVLRWPVKSRKESCDSKSRGQEQEQEQIHAVSPQWLSPEGREGQLGSMRVPTALSADQEQEAARISDKVVNNFHGSAAAPTIPKQPSAMVGFPSAGAPATNQSHESKKMQILQGGNLSLFDKFLDHKMETVGERQVPINGIHGAKNASVYSVNRDQAHDYQSSLMILSALRDVEKGEAASQVSVDAMATTMHLLNHLQASQQAASRVSMAASPSFASITAQMNPSPPSMTLSPRALPGAVNVRHSVIQLCRNSTICSTNCQFLIKAVAELSGVELSGNKAPNHTGPPKVSLHLSPDSDHGVQVMDIIRMQGSFSDAGIHNVQRDMMPHMPDSPVQVPELNTRLLSDLRLLLQLS